MTRFCITTCGLLLLATTAAAQRGTVRYEQVVTQTYDITDALKEIEGIEELIAQFPQNQAARHILHFDESAYAMGLDEAYLDSLRSSFDGQEFMESLDPEQMMQMMRAMGELMSTMGDQLVEASANPEPHAVYVNFEDGVYTEEHQLFDRTFLVSGDLELPAWRLTSEERSFLGHRILKATAVQDSVNLEAWFTPEIPVPAGPALYGGLPGLILVLSLGGDSLTYTAQAIDLESGEPVEPFTDGKVVTRKEFEQIARDKAREFRDEMNRNRSRGFNFDY